MSSVGSVGEGFFRRILLMVDLGDENPRHTTRVKRCASGRQSGDERVACIDRSFVRFHDTDYRLATRQETVSGLRPPPIFVEEEIGMKPQPQRCSLSRTVAVIARQTRRSWHPPTITSITSRGPLCRFLRNVPPPVINTGALPRFVEFATMTPTHLASFLRLWNLPVCTPGWTCVMKLNVTRRCCTLVYHGGLRLTRR